MLRFEGWARSGLCAHYEPDLWATRGMAKALCLDERYLLQVSRGYPFKGVLLRSSGSDMYFNGENLLWRP